MWKHVISSDQNPTHYCVCQGGWSGRKNEHDGEIALKDLKEAFPSTRSIEDWYDFVLFSTSGVYGSYDTIEDAEANPGKIDVTFLVVSTRRVALWFGNCRPKTKEDFDFLKNLRKVSMQALQAQAIDVLEK